MEIDHADELFISHAADGTVSIQLFNSNEASVTSGILVTQNTHADEIGGLQEVDTALAAEMELQAMAFDEVTFE
jgi:hypothetical protein